jgi:hypothetical protein
MTPMEYALAGFLTFAFALALRGVVRDAVRCYRQRNERHATRWARRRQHLNPNLLRRMK